MKKKWLFIPVALLMITGLMLAGCEDGSTPDNKNPIDTGISYTVTQRGGILNKQDTTIIDFVFTSTIARGGLEVSDLTFTDGTGKIIPGTMNDTASPTRTLNITVETQGTVKVKIKKAGISAAERTVEVYKKLGYVEDSTVGIGDVVKFGTPAKGPNISFARFDGDPIAELPPVSREPISSMNAANPAVNQVLATFSPAVDLTDKSDGQFRWFDMAWDGYGASWTSGETLLFLHKITFQLELTTDASATVLFQKEVQVTSNGMDKPVVRFYLADIPSTSTAWGTGHKISQIAVKVIGMEYTTGSSYPGISTYPVTLNDTWVISLTADTRMPPPPKMLYNSAGFSSDISNPKLGFGDDFLDNAEAITTIPQFFGKDNEQKIIFWYPLDITAPAQYAPYSTLIVNATVGNMYWHGYGTTSVNDNDEIIRQMNFSGAGIKARTVLELSSDKYPNSYFNEKKFMGFFLQWNASPAGSTTSNPVTITEIWLE